MCLGFRFDQHVIGNWFASETSIGVAVPVDTRDELVKIGCMLQGNPARFAGPRGDAVQLGRAKQAVHEGRPVANVL